MAGAHLPNSHPSVTPDWKDLGYTRTAFKDAISLQTVGESDNHYTGFAPLDWCIPHNRGPGLHGGYIAAILIAGCRKYFHAKYPNLQQPDPIQMHLQFLHFVPPGTFHVHFDDLKMGKTVSAIQIKFFASDSETTPRTIALVSMGSLENDTGISIKLPLLIVPDREECSRWTNAFFYHFNPPTSAVRYYNPNDGENLMWSPKLGQNARDQWGKLDDDDMFHLEHLGLVADLIPAIHMNYQDSALEAVLHYDYPTVSMDLDFLKDPAGREEWLLMRTKMYKLQNGRFDMHVQIIDDDGDLVATAKQTCLVLKRSGLGDIGMRSRM